MKVNTKSMFEAIKQSLSDSKNKSTVNGTYKEILKFTAGNTYLLRLVPNPNSPKDSIFHHYTHGWNSNATGKYVTAMCPTTFGDTCPIDAYYLKTYRNGTESEKEAAKVLSRKEGWFANVYVISDPTNPENEGKVKILRYGRELDKIISSALEGDDAREFGVEKVYDVLSGSTLRIKCEKRTEKGRNASQMVTYASSKFLSASDLDLTEDDIEEIYNAVHDLRTVNKQTTAAEMQRLLDEHFFCLTTGSASDDDDSEVSSYTPPVIKKPAPKEVVEDILENTVSSIPASKGKPLHKLDIVEDDKATQDSTDEALKRLLADL
jgi:hypothetical protein